jgi:hypothetical protein
MSMPSAAPPEAAEAPRAREQVRLGDRVLELEPEQAAAVRDAFQGLATSYSAALEEQRRQTLQTLGTPGWTAPVHPPEPPPGLEVPDPDLLFANKDAWQEGFARSLEARLGSLRGEQAALVQGAVAAVDEELRRRDQRAQAQNLHDATMEEMLERRGLSDHRRIVQAVYNDEYARVQHLPLAMAIDHIGQVASEEIAAIRGGAAEAPTAEAPTPPALLRSARRAGTTGSAPAPAPAKSLSDLIRHRQQVLVHGNAA